MAYDGSSPEAKKLLKSEYFVADPAVVEGPKGGILFSVSDYENSYTTIGPIESFPDIKNSLQAMALIQLMKKDIAKSLYGDLYTGKFSSFPQKDHRKEADRTIQFRLDRERKSTSPETEIIHLAILYLARINDSWCQGAAVDHKGRVCMLGALEREADGRGTIEKINIEAGRQASARYGGAWGLGHYFNDDPLTNKSMVLHVLLDIFESFGGIYE